ncbi:hypothetical protein BS47DRAFT_1343837 [Hydnum rufescens UP504]|uniref:Uncharacterized protein n=1 Tax=Hydnum rufescens UP504 TaxID=1448309 RepID=A0A9P6AXR7_9AGAM|nr:hypothetical protein BS47DRAFT_1343837 [Hydnum rufescens UP504]
MHTSQFYRADQSYPNTIDLTLQGHYSVSDLKHCLLDKPAVQPSLESHILLELRHYKNSRNPLHEFLIGEFRSGADAIFVATERGTRGKSQFADESCFALLDIDPYDLFWVVPDEITFDAAVESIVKGWKSRSDPSAFIQCGSVKYRFGQTNDKSPSPPTEPPSTTPRPTLTHLIFAAAAVHDTTSSLIDDERSLYAHAIRQIFIDTFQPSEPVHVEETKDTSKAFPGLLEVYQSLEQDWLANPSDEEIPSPTESETSEAELSEPESMNQSNGIPKEEVPRLERQQYLNLAQEIECDIEAAKLEIKQLEGLSESEREGHMSEKRMKLGLEKLEAQRELYLAQAERTDRDIEIVILESERLEREDELQQRQAEVLEIRRALDTLVLK